MDARHRKEANLDGDRVGQGQAGRFIRGSDWEIWHLYSGGFERR